MGKQTKKPVTGKNATGSNKEKASQGSGRATKPAKRTEKKSEIQKEKTVSQKTKGKQNEKTKAKRKFPKKFPFWARLKISKNRTTLVIDEDKMLDKKSRNIEEVFIHRESTHRRLRKDYEEIKPNPDSTDNNPMYLKRPKKLPKRMFKPHNKKLDMPQHLKERYDKNNYKEK